MLARRDFDGLGMDIFGEHVRSFGRDVIYVGDTRDLGRWSSFEYTRELCIQDKITIWYAVKLHFYGESSLDDMMYSRIGLFVFF